MGPGSSRFALGRDDRRGARAPTAYYAEARATDEKRNAVLAEVGRLATTL